jgi:hypothetical protein
VLTACLPDPGRILGLPWPLARPLGRRMKAVNDVVHALSERYAAVHLHTAGHPWAHSRSAWSVDRLHPSELGHRLLAREFHALLVAEGLARGRPPQAVPDGPPPGRAAGARWMATRGTKWVVDRCGDLLPDLLRLAMAELRCARSGPAALDLASHRATVRALAALPPSGRSPQGVPLPPAATGGGPAPGGMSSSAASSPVSG